MSETPEEIPPATELSETEFEEWCARLREISAADPHRYGPDAVTSLGPSAWYFYFKIGYTPEDAWMEDAWVDDSWLESFWIDDLSEDDDKSVD